MVVVVVYTEFILYYITFRSILIALYYILLYISHYVRKNCSYAYGYLVIICVYLHLALAPIDVILRIQYEEEWYRVQEEAGYVTLALVLEGNTSVPVTVTVKTLDLQDGSFGATGELLELFCF